MLSPVEDGIFVNFFQESGRINDTLSSTNSIEIDEHFEVESILDHRMSSDQHIHEYLIKWKNCSAFSIPRSQNVIRSTYPQIFGQIEELQCFFQFLDHS